MKETIQKEAWTAIRLNKNSGREWLDRNSVGYDKQGSEEKVKTIDDAIPQWDKENPVVRIVEVMIKEKVSDEHSYE